MKNAIKTAIAEILSENSLGEKDIKRILELIEKGYSAIEQMVEYLLTEEPTYITNHKNARTLIRKLDRDELLQELVREYLDN